MKIVRFELNAAAETLFDEIRATDEFLETTPKLFFVKSMRAFMQSKVAAAEKLKAETAPKQPPQRETAEERKKRVREEYRERELEEYRSSGEWPRVQRYKQLPGNISAYKDGQAEFLEGKILFTMPGDPDRSYIWMPSEDYPHMDDYQKAQREMAEMMGEVDPNYPKQEDYDTTDEFYDAENLYLRTTQRDAVDAMPTLSAPVRTKVIVPASSAGLADELQAIFDMN